MLPLDKAHALPARRQARRGFTLIEAAMVTVVIGVGVLGMLQLLAAGTASNADAAEQTTAMTLAGSVREMSLGLALYDPQQDPKVAPRVWESKEASITAYDNVTDLDGPNDTWHKPEDPKGFQTFSPPRDGTRQVIPGHLNWAQYVKVETVDPTHVTRLLPHNPDGEVVRVTAKITRDEIEVYRSSWLVFAPQAAKRNDAP
jgi:type II secretory pathway pseudopilin PulG